MSSKVREMGKHCQIDWTRVDYYLDAGTKRDDWSGLHPDHYISFAREDFRVGGTRGLINALTNAKRSIDCSADKFFYANKLTDIVNSPNTAVWDYIRLCEDELPSRGSNVKFQLLHALGVAPSNLIAEVRSLRHKLEHEYVVPDTRETRDAIELAQLFSGCVELALNVADPLFIGSDREGDRPRSQLAVSMLWQQSLELRQMGPDPNVQKVYPDELEFFPLLKLSILSWNQRDIQTAHKELLQCIGLDAQHMGRPPQIVLA